MSNLSLSYLLTIWKASQAGYFLLFFHRWNGEYINTIKHTAKYWIEPGCETENIHREILVSQLHWKLLLLPDCCAFSLFFGLLGIRHTIDSSKDEGIFLKERNLTCGKNLNKFQQPNAETLLFFFCVYEKQHPHHTASECWEMRDA